jgi:hypothetical protein
VLSGASARPPQLGHLTLDDELVFLLVLSCFPGLHLPAMSQINGTKTTWPPMQTHHHLRHSFGLALAAAWTAASTAAAVHSGEPARGLRRKRRFTWSAQPATMSRRHGVVRSSQSGRARPPAFVFRISYDEQRGWVGRYFADFAVGDVYEHPLGPTITTTDNIWFTLCRFALARSTKPAPR